MYIIMQIILVVINVEYVDVTGCDVTMEIF